MTHHIRKYALRWTKSILLFVSLAHIWILISNNSQVSAQLPVGTSCPESRVRRTWDSLDSSEKSTYLSAVYLAMLRGHHQKFVELHTEWFSERQAHQNCMFIYWHRKFLLGYENMLRSMGPSYSCVTLPVWDHLHNSAKRANGLCGSLEHCSLILREMGGTRIGSLLSNRIYNQTVVRASNSLCITEGIAGAFCGNNTECAGCIVRGPAHQRGYPSEAYFGAVWNQLFTYNDNARFTSMIETGVHNSVHSQVGGVMGTFSSPIDPVFYSHHAFIDSLQAIYFKCQNNGEILIPLSQKGSDPRFWSSCGRRTGGFYTSKDEITLSTRDYDGRWTSVHGDPRNTLYNYFKDLPKTFAEYIDAKDLGPYSYTYEFRGGSAAMYQMCRDSNKISSSLMAEAELSQAHVQIASEHMLPRTVAGKSYETKVHRWSIAMYEAARIVGFVDGASNEQMELISCIHQDECLGGVADYTEVFKANFQPEGHPRCYTLLDEYYKGLKVIAIPGWREITHKFLPCPHPKKKNMRRARVKIAKT